MLLVVTEVEVAIIRVQQCCLFAGLKPGSGCFFFLSGVSQGRPRRAHRYFVLYISGVKNGVGLG